MGRYGESLDERTSAVVNFSVAISSFGNDWVVPPHGSDLLGSDETENVEESIFVLGLLFPLKCGIWSVCALAGVIELVEEGGVDGELGELVEVEYSGIVVSVVSAVREHVLRQEAAG